MRKHLVIAGLASVFAMPLCAGVWCLGQESAQSCADAEAVIPTKKAGVFYSPAMVARARQNAATQAWAAQTRDGLVAAAQPWLRMSDEELWDLMFSNGIKRSWMVWSNGHCPACQQSVPMYEWVVDALARPWKMQCPHCQELFPKNDFHKFYRSGLNEQGVFEPARRPQSAGEPRAS